MIARVSILYMTKQKDRLIEDMRESARPPVRALRLSSTKAKRVWDFAPPELRWDIPKMKFPSTTSIDSNRERLFKKLRNLDFKHVRTSGDVGIWTYIFHYNKSIRGTKLILYIDEQTRRKPHTRQITLDYVSLVSRNLRSR